MTAPIPPQSVAAGAPAADPSRRSDPRLASSAQQLEGLFVQQLFAAMRETIPDNGPLSGGPGEAMFTAMLHEHLAALAPQRWTHGLSGEIARQLAQASGAAPDLTP